MGWLQAAATIGSALIGGIGQSSANRQNLAEAQRNRDFQERMRATQYQTAAADLEAAGLNRILALGSPAGNLPGNMAQVGNVGAAAMTGAAQGTQAVSTQMQLQPKIDALAAQMKLNEAQTQKLALIVRMNEYGEQILDFIEANWKDGTIQRTAQGWMDALREWWDQYEFPWPEFNFELGLHLTDFFSDKPETANWLEDIDSKGGALR